MVDWYTRRELSTEDGDLITESQMACISTWRDWRVSLYLGSGEDGFYTYFRHYTSHSTRALASILLRVIMSSGQTPFIQRVRYVDVPFKAYFVGDYQHISVGPN